MATGYVLTCDIDEDGLADVVSADHTAHRGVWHKNPGIDANTLWQGNLIYRNIRLPGDFAMEDVGVGGNFRVIATSYVEGGGKFQPVPGVDYMASSEQLALGAGQVNVDLALTPVPEGPP
jgi:hypothetical protein